ncbi:hypothetical protein [Xylanimonas sp. McL0601]|uniref:hypothetical protein n=1 Tax=Xylanimonas sp. McL0601 TaxID=3414739 RepID=UPI003CFB7095
MDPDALSDAQKALRAQLLATEHWSLLASRSTTQNEVLTRIAIFLTLVSAGLVTVGVLGQASNFEGWFTAAALGVLLLLSVLGFITTVRVYLTGSEDLMYVLAMNRLRGAYLDLAPDLAPYLLMSPNDDEAGAGRTYDYFTTRGFTHVIGSSMVLCATVDAVVSALFVGSLLATLALPMPAAVAIGCAVALLVLTGWMSIGYRTYRRSLELHVPMRRTPPA